MDGTTEPTKPKLLRRFVLFPLARSVMLLRSGVEFRRTRKDGKGGWREETDEEMQERALR